MPTHWAVVISKPCQEEKAAKNLAQSGLDCFLPKVRFRGKLEPAFRRYLFATAEYGYQTLLDIYGVFDVVRLGGRPVSLPDAVVAGLKARCVDGVLCTPPRLQYGMTVYAESGVFANQIGRIVRISSEKRIEVLFHILGRYARVQMDESNLIAA